MAKATIDKVTQEMHIQTQKPFLEVTATVEYDDLSTETIKRAYEVDTTSAEITADVEKSVRALQEERDSRVANAARDATQKQATETIVALEGAEIVATSKK